MKRFLALAAVAAATFLVAGAAQAAHVRWSVGIELPPVATYVSGGPVYAPAPVRYVTRPYAPYRHVYVEPAYAPSGYVPGGYVPSGYGPAVYRPPVYRAAPVYLPRPPRLWLPPLPPLPRPVFFGHGGWHGGGHEGWNRGDRGDPGDRGDRHGRR